MNEPSLQVLTSGEPTVDDQEAIETLVRRRDYLVAELHEREERKRSFYVRAEISALNWALGFAPGLSLLAERRKNLLDDDPDFRDKERSHDDLLADEAAEALRPDSDEPAEEAGDKERKPD